MTLARPDRIARLGLGLQAARTLLAALELGVFTQLGRGPRTRAQLQRSLPLDAATAADLLDALVALQLLERDGDDEDAVYVNTREAGRYLDARSADCLADWLREQHWRAGLAAPWPPRRQAAPVPADPAWTRVLAAALVQQCELAATRTALTAGDHAVPLLCALAQALPQLEGLALVPAPQLDAARRFIASSGLAPRVLARERDERWPAAQAVIQHAGSAWRTDLQRARAALPEGGVLLLIGPWLDAARRHDADALLAVMGRRLDGDAFESCTEAAARAACEAAGFAHSRGQSLLGGTGVVQAWR